MDKKIKAYPLLATNSSLWKSVLCIPEVLYTVTDEEQRSSVPDYLNYWASLTLLMLKIQSHSPGGWVAINWAVSTGLLNITPPGAIFNNKRGKLVHFHVLNDQLTWAKGASSEKRILEYPLVSQPRSKTDILGRWRWLCWLRYFDSRLGKDLKSLLSNWDASDVWTYMPLFSKVLTDLKPERNSLLV